MPCIVMSCMHIERVLQEDFHKFNLFPRSCNHAKACPITWSSYAKLINNILNKWNLSLFEITESDRYAQLAWINYTLLKVVSALILTLQ